jgi:hypothetical protein
MTRPIGFSSVSESTAVQWSEAIRFMSELVRGLMQLSPCEPLLLEAGS